MSTALATLDTEIVDHETGEISPSEISPSELSVIPAPDAERSVTVSDPFVGIAATPFSEQAAATLMATVSDELVEIRPDGLLYLPNIQYRKILNTAFGPGAWAVMPRAINVDAGANMMYYRGALFVHGRFISEAIGEQQYFPDNGNMTYATAAEAAKSNCLLRCCKDIGIACDLWDPTFIARWKEAFAVEVWCQNKQDPNRKKKLWRKRSAPAIDQYPWCEIGGTTGGGSGGASRPAGEAGYDGRDFDRQWDDNGAQGATERAPAGNGNGKGYSTTRPITEKQVWRLNKLAKQGGWSQSDVDALIREHGFTSATEITMGEKYEAICSTIESRLKT